MKVKNVIFDLGAVMFEWNPEKIAANFTGDAHLQERILSEFYYHQTWMDFDCGHITEEQAIQRASESLLLPLEDAKRLVEQTKASLVLITKTRDILNYVKEKKLNAYCLSNISLELLEYLSHRNDLFNLFDGIVTSGAENVAKPDEKIFKILLDRYQLKAEECFFIDDSTANTKTANKLGIQTVTFDGSDRCYDQIYSHL